MLNMNNNNLWKVQAKHTALMMAGVIAIAATSVAQADSQYEDTARVISVTPQVERVNNPTQDCRTEYVPETYRSESSPAGAIIGGIAGGLLGSTVGKGTGRVASAAVGAGVGAVVGDRVGNNQNTTTGSRPIERCASVDNWQTVNRGYLVSYEYNGHQYSTVTSADPGPAMRVRISVQPAIAPPQVGYYDAAPSGVIYREPVYIDRPRGRGRWDY